MKVLFLVQSCNKERYIKEEDIIRNTWGSRIWKNCDLYFYRGGGEDILEGDVLSLKCGDKLEDTFVKTIRALKVFKNKYDFIIRTNTSTWINTEVLLNTLKTIDINEHNLIGGNIVSNTGSQGIPFLRGNFLVLNKTVQNDLFESIEGKVYTGVDDVAKVADALTEAGYHLLSAQVEMLPQNGTVKLTNEDDIKNMQKMLDMFEDNDDVQNVWHNWEDAE